MATRYERAKLSWKNRRANKGRRPAVSKKGTGIVRAQKRKP